MQIRVKTSIKAQKWLGGGGTPNPRVLTNYTLSLFKKPRLKIGLGLFEIFAIDFLGT